MTRARRRLTILVGFALPLMLATTDASAARHHSARVATATYRTRLRPHAPQRLRVGVPHSSRFAEIGYRVLLTGS